MILRGFTIKMGDNINTDLVISGRYKFSIIDLKELSKHIFEDYNSNFSSKIKKGESIIVAGKNFGMGSSREQAPLVIKESGIICVLAKTFSRIFYRNSFNIGLPLIETDTTKISQDDLLEIDLDKGRLLNLTKNIELKIKPIPKFMQETLKEGGIINYYKKYGRFPEIRL
jgi:3-isopropylmalate/(R)-2-methylmalate dehydratase small subunit